MISYIIFCNKQVESITSRVLKHPFCFLIKVNNSLKPTLIIKVVFLGG